MDSIKITNLTYRYPTAEEPVLKNVSLNVKKGELCAVVGANGSGKTTLCNAIRGFVPKFYNVNLILLIFAYIGIITETFILTSGGLLFMQKIIREIIIR